MIAGRMRDRLIAYKPVYVTDDYGSQSVEYASIGYIRAERVKYTGKQVVEGGERFGDYSASWNVRAAHRVEEHWRVQSTGADTSLYEVTNVLPVAGKGMKTLQCEKVNL